MVFDRAHPINGDCDLCGVNMDIVPGDACPDCKMELCGDCWWRHRAEPHRQAGLALGDA